MVGHRDNRRCRLSLQKLLGQVRARQRAGRVARELLFDQLRHPLVGALLEAFGQAHHRDPRAGVRSELGQGAPERVGGDGHDDHIGPSGGLGDLRGRPQARMQGEAGQVVRVLVRRGDLLGELGTAGPQQRRGVAGRERGDGGAPRSGTNDGHLWRAHVVPPWGWTGLTRRCSRWRPNAPPGGLTQPRRAGQPHRPDGLRNCCIRPDTEPMEDASGAADRVRRGRPCERPCRGPPTAAAPATCCPARRPAPTGIHVAHRLSRGHRGVPSARPRSRATQSPSSVAQPGFDRCTPSAAMSASMAASCTAGASYCGS